MRSLVRSAALSLLISAPAFAQYLNFKMTCDADHPFSFYADTRVTAPQGLDGATITSTTTRAMNTWTSPSCSAANIRLVGGTTGVVANAQDTLDAFSVAPVWMLNGNDPDYMEIIGNPATAAVAVARSYAGVLSTCDILLNGVTHTYSLAAVTPSTSMDFESVIAHELGHCLGMDHVAMLGSIMTPVIEPGEQRRGLTQEDATRLCDRYPATGKFSAPCSADAGCLPEFKCVEQPETSGIVRSLCTSGCTINVGATCETPFVCAASTAFAPQSGACLLPGNMVTQVGRACGVPADCGGANAVCLAPQNAPSGGQFWRDGYCTAVCGAGSAACPAGSTCTNVSGTQRCLQSCRVGLADCRPGYSCLEIDAVGTSGVCFPSCATNADCSDLVNTECRVCDGTCVPRQAVGQIGDYCVDNSTCGTGQVCRATGETSTQKQCTMTCSRGCGTCPNGTTCTPGARGELFCLRNCTGPGQCPNGLRCADTPTGKACQPWCQATSDCPVGQFCFMGECYADNPDANCGTLCNRPDGGPPVVVVPRDAGNGGGGTGGCGCGSVDPSLVFAALALFAVRRRRP